MQPKLLPLLLLVLLPAESRSSASEARDSQALERRTAPGRSSTEGASVAGSCDDLRDAEAVLAEQQVHLLDRLALPAATREEKSTWKGELENGLEFLENLDRAMEALNCPSR